MDGLREIPTTCPHLELRIRQRRKRWAHQHCSRLRTMARRSETTRHAARPHLASPDSNHLSFAVLVPTSFETEPYMLVFRKPLDGIERPTMDADVVIVGGG